MAYGPCLNPNCSSHGAPHPNCRCYGNMAKGGLADFFCSTNQAHEPSCQYFAQGGQVSPLSDPTTATAGALAHGGASMLFGNPKSPYFGAFGSGSAPSKLAGSPEQANIAAYMTKVSRGTKAIDRSVKSLFNGSKHDLDSVSEKELEDLKEYVDNGGAIQEAQAFAQVGKVEDPLSTLLPDHSFQLNAAKSRVSGYLNSQKPQEAPRLPFDAKPSMKADDKHYKESLELAARPLKIVDNIREGNITPKDLKNFVGMYPELHDHLSKKMTEEITKYQLEGKRPSYRVRQGMSLFMGSPLDSTFTPQNIIAVQGVFAQKAAQQQAASPVSGKNKKDTATLSKASSQYQTDGQAAEARQRKQ